MEDQKTIRRIEKSKVLQHFSKSLIIITALVGVIGNITAPEFAFRERSPLYMISEWLLGIINLVLIIFLLAESIIYMISLYEDNIDAKVSSKKIIYNLLIALLISAISYSLMVRIEVFPV